MQEYIITLHSFEDLDDFYDDMETPGGNLYIPDRNVDVAMRRPRSRNTNYMLEEDEVALIRNDPRVLDIVSVEEYKKRIEAEPLGWIQDSDYWWRSNTMASEHKNWGLLRVIEGTQDGSWGTTYSNRTGEITSTLAGEHVDVIIADGLINPNHPEFTVNADGTGNIRFVKLDWDVFSRNIFGIADDQVVPSINHYLYGDTNSTVYGADHGMHVAGTVAGNTQGWAKSANIYNISPYSNGINSFIFYTYKYNFIQEFHETKPINPITGKKNPTIVNASYGSSLPRDMTNASITFRGTVVTNDASSLTTTQLRSYGLNGSITQTTVDNVTTKYIRIPVIDNSEITDIQDMLAAGVIMIGSGGNYNEIYALSSEADYDNKLTESNGTDHFYCRGDHKRMGGAIISGAADYYGNDRKAFFSAKGSAIDCYAPGMAIASSLHQTGDDTDTTKYADPRDSNFVVGKYQGTSMSSPQMTGVIACLLETQQNMTHEEVRDWLHGPGSKKNQMYDGGLDLNGNYDLVNESGEANRYLYHVQQRTTSGTSLSVLNNKREESGLVFPRVKLQTRTKKLEIGDWHRVYVHSASSASSYITLTGQDTNGYFTGQQNYTINMVVNDVLSIVNPRYATHPIIISATSAGPISANCLLTENGGVQFNPQSAGTYYYYCTTHNSMTGDIVVSASNTPTYSVTAQGGATSVNEGSTLTFDVATSNVTDGTTLYWSVSNAGDFATSTGSFNITSNAGTIDIIPTSDATTEGAETFTVSVRTGSVSGTVVATSNAITINDTSQTPGPSYNIATAGNVTSIDEGSSLTFNVTTTNVADATTLYYTLTNAGDFATSSGSFTITANAGSFSVLPTADTTTEGAETFEAQIRTDSVGGTIVVTSSSITINDTSLTADPTYSVVPQNNATDVDEGTTLLMNVTTTNVDDATTLYWTVTNAGDFTTSSGSFTITSNTGSFSVQPDADATTEAVAETFQAQVRTGSTSGTIVAQTQNITINDTSQTPTFTPDYTINVTALDSNNYTMSGTDANGSVSGTDPSLTFASGDKVRFAMNVASIHIMYIKTMNSTGTGNQAGGVVNNGAYNGNIDWTIPSSGSFHYNCVNHSGMNGPITVT